MIYNYRNESVSVGTTSVQIVPLVEEGAREVCAIKNTSTGGQKITISINLTAVSGAGIVLNPSESWVESKDVAYYPPKEPIYVISDGANGTIALYERIRK